VQELAKAARKAEELEAAAAQTPAAAVLEVVCFSGVCSMR
jgi:hypothetical protein